MEPHPRTDFRKTRRLVPALALSVSLLATGCSSEGPAPAPEKADPGAATSPAGTAKAKKLRPGQQDPGAANYEDKPGSRTRGR